MIQAKSNCAVCQVIKHDKFLMKRIYESSYFIPSSKESLNKIQKDYDDKFKYKSLLNHVKKHQWLNKEEYERKIEKIAKEKVQTMNDIQTARERFEATDVWDDILSEGKRKMDSGEIQITANHMLKAAKDKTDFEMKQKNHQLAVMEMIFHFASGENRSPHVRGFNPEASITDNTTTTEASGSII